MSGRPTILVTGGAGYIGSHVVLALTEAGYSVVVVDNLSTGCRSMLPPDVRLVEADVGDGALLRQLLRDSKVKSVLHFAASIRVADSVADPLAYYRNNVAVSLSLLEACAAAGVDHVVFSSTAAVYGEPDRLPVDEDAPTHPLSPYGASKLMTERMLADLARSSPLTFVALRYFNVAGSDPGGRIGQMSPNASHLIKRACEAALGRLDRFDIFGDDYPTPDGTCVRDYIHVSDLADAHLAALSYLEGGGSSQILNCGYGRGYSVREVVEAVSRCSGRQLRVGMAPRRPGDSPAVVAATERIRRVLGWTPRLDDLDILIRTTLDWEQRQPGSLGTDGQGSVVPRHG